MICSGIPKVNFLAIFPVKTMVLMKILNSESQGAVIFTHCCSLYSYWQVYLTITHNRWIHGESVTPCTESLTNHPSWDIHQPRSGSPTGKADIRRQHMQSQASKLLGSWKKPSKNASKLRCKRAKLSQAHTVCGARTGKLCIRRCARPQHLASRKMTGILWIKEDLPAFFLRKADGILSYRQ